MTNLSSGVIWQDYDNRSIEAKECIFETFLCFDAFSELWSFTAFNINTSYDYSIKNCVHQYHLSFYVLEHHGIIFSYILENNDISKEFSIDFNKTDEESLLLYAFRNNPWSYANNHRMDK